MKRIELEPKASPRVRARIAFASVTLAILAASAVTLPALAQTSALPAGYSIHASLPLTVGPDRATGQIQVLEDSRIRPAMESSIRESWGGNPCSDQPPAVLRDLCSSPDAAPLRPAMLRLVDATGRVIDTRAAERPLADLAVNSLYGGSSSSRHTYFFTVDLSAGAGSYSGPYTRLAEPTSAGFNWLQATDTLGAHPDTITLVSTLKSGWQIAPRASGGGVDLLVVRCRPNLGPSAGPTPSFQLTFERFSLARDHWVRRSRTDDGCWESDDAFPGRSRFP